MDEVLSRAGEWLGALEAQAQTVFETGLVTPALGTLQARAIEHPIVAAAGLSAIGITLLVARNVLVLIAVAFFAIAALAGTEPVTDPLARQVFPIGCFVALGFILLVIRAQRRSIETLRRDRSERDEKHEEQR